MNVQSLAKRLVFAVILMAVTAAIIYYGAVWLLIRRVAAMPDSPPPVVRPVRSNTAKGVSSYKKE